eukprot:PITA_17244
MPKALDPFWEYGNPDGGTNRAYLTCKLCGTRMTSGVTGLKYHLARLSGHDVGICTISSLKLIQKSLKVIDEKDRKEEAERNKVECAGRSFWISSPDFDVEGSGRGSIAGTSSPATASARSSFFVPQTGHGAQPSIKSLVKKKEKQDADRVIGRCIFWSDLPLSISKTNPFWQPMCDAIAVVGPGYKSATYEELRGPILQAKRQDINSRLAELKKTLEVTRCTVMSDGWTDKKGRTLLNFLNVVQVVTDNAANYVSVGKMLMERHPTLFWTPCAAHCLDLLLEDMGKLSFIKEALDMARSIPKFIYNHAFVLSLMRRYNRRHDGKAIAKLVYSETFWRGVEEACTVSEPIVKVLRLVDGEKLAMAYLYEGMDRAKEAIRSYYADKGSIGLDR